MKRPLAIAGLALLAGCGAPAASSTAPHRAEIAVASPMPAAAPVLSARMTPDEPFRQKPPEPGPAHPFQAPAVTEARLKNGIRVAVVPTPSPSVALRVVASGGIGDVGAANVETVRLMAMAMVLESKARGVPAVEAALADCGMPSPEISVYPDALIVSALVPIAKLEAAAELLADVIFHPAFEKSLLRRREQLERAREADQDNATITDRVMRRVLFGAHEYGATFGSSAAVHAITRSAVVTAHDRVFDPSRVTIVAVGGSPAAQIVSALEASFGEAKASAGVRPSVVSVPGPPTSPRLVVVDKAGATMATVYAASVGPSTASADGDAAALAARILAGGGGGRLTLRLRDELHDAPWVYWTFYQLRASGVIGWRTQLPVDRVAPSLAEADKVMRTFAAQGPTDEEMATFGGEAASEFTGSFDTARSMARIYGQAVADARPLDEVARAPARIAALTRDGVKAAAARFLDADRQRIVIVGDWQKLREPLTALGWGRIELRNADGTLASAEASHGGK